LIRNKINFKNEKLKRCS